MIHHKIVIRQKNVANAVSAREIMVEVEILDYDEGNAFAPAMLAGLGQIRIDSKVEIFAGTQHQKIGAFDLNKTFAWGGIYGGATDIHDVEEGFSEGVAAAVMGD